MYRYLAFEGVIDHVSEGSRFPMRKCSNRRNFMMRFRDRLDHQPSPIASWAHTLYVRDRQIHEHTYYATSRGTWPQISAIEDGSDPAHEDGDRLNRQAIWSLLPRLTSLTSFVCHMTISVEDLGTLESFVGTRLRSLFLQFECFDPEVPTMVSRMTVLEGLGIYFEAQIEHLGEGAHVAAPENLQRLDLLGTSINFPPVLYWVGSTRNSRLLELKIHTSGDLPMEPLHFLLSTCGGSLTRLQLPRLGATDYDHVFQHVPHLRYMALRLQYSHVRSFVNEMPASLTTLSLWNRTRGVSALHLVLQLVSCIRRCRKGTLLRAIRMTRPNKNFNGNPLLWEEDRAGQTSQAHRAWLSPLFESLKEIGVVLLDDEDVQLTDFLADRDERGLDQGAKEIYDTSRYR
ncbi:hypothetical protein BKA63DRAFT_14967 [Paraphoma chrysanthemicola]|nr:hypothetical protein BKA63DRAFT_14967 [Paraphoma chrysanthemicola]